MVQYAIGFLPKPRARTQTLNSALVLVKIPGSSTANPAAAPDVLEDLKHQLCRLPTGERAQSTGHQSSHFQLPLQTTWSASYVSQMPQGPGPGSGIGSMLSSPTLNGAGPARRSSDQVRALVAHGGSFRSAGFGGSCEYVGGAQKLVLLNRTWNVQQLQQRLCTLADVCYQQCNIKYALPGAPGAPTYIDLYSDEDVELMWEEWADYAAATGHHGAKLQLFVDCGGHSYPDSSRGRGSMTSSSSGDAQLLPPASSLLSQPDTPTLASLASLGPAYTDGVVQADAAAAAAAAAMAGMSIGPGPTAAAAMPTQGDPRGHSGARSTPTTAVAECGQQQLQQLTHAAADSSRQEESAWPVIHRPAHVSTWHTVACDAEGAEDPEELFVTVTGNLLTAASMVLKTTAGTHSSRHQHAAAIADSATATAAAAAAAAAPRDSRHTGELSMPQGLGSRSSSSSSSTSTSISSTVSGGLSVAVPATPELQELADSSRGAIPAVLTAPSALTSSRRDLSYRSGTGIGSLSDRQRQQQDLRELVAELRSRVEVLSPEQLQVTRFLGGGAFGEVYLARWLGSEVAVKCLSPSLLASQTSSSSRSSSDQAVVELLKEAAVLASLHHPNLVTCFGVVLSPSGLLDDTAADEDESAGEDDVIMADLEKRRSSFMQWGFSESETAAAAAAGPWDRHSFSSSSSSRGFVGAAGHHPSAPAMVTEYLAAGSLRQALCSRADWLNSNMAKVKMLLDTARGLNYLHSKRLVHFDLKSANLLVTVRDKVPCVKIADFGLTKARSQTYVTGVDSLRGTLPWIAPEILKHPHEGVTESADIYSFGVIMWELWTGQEPYEGVQLHALLHQLVSPAGLSLPVPGSSDWVDEPVPAEPAPGWAALMQQCWLPPQHRPTAGQVVVMLEAMMGKLRALRTMSSTDGSNRAS